MLRVEVVSAWPDHARHGWYDLPEGSTVALALAAFEREFGPIDTTDGVGIHGTLCDGSRVLRDGDRVEIYRPLQADAKQARRERARRARE